MSQSADKAPILIYNLKDKLSKVLECNGTFTKYAKFKKIDGVAAKYGASKTNA